MTDLKLPKAQRYSLKPDAPYLDFEKDGWWVRWRDERGYVVA